MEPRIVERGPLHLVGVELENGEPKSYLILQVWVALAARARRIERVIEPDVLYGVWLSRPAAEPSYLVGVEVEEVSAPPEGLAVASVPACRFASFTHRGSLGSIAATYEQMAKWMADSGTEHAEAATVEIYDTRQTIDDEYVVEVLEPIR